MDENIGKLKENIFISTKDMDDIMNSLKNINGNTIIVGTGGSRAVAEFASSVLEKKNHIITKVIDVRDLYYMDLSLYENIFIASYSGSNFGVKYCFNNNLKKYLLTHRVTKVEDEELLSYEMEPEKSFISLNSTIVPMACLLKYYLEDKFDILIEEMFNNVDQDLYMELGSDYVNIFEGIDTVATNDFIASTLAESGLSSPVMHEKYNYCHGRSTMNKNHDHTAIYIGYNNSELDQAIKEVLDIQMSNYLILEQKYEDNVTNDFYLTLQSLYLLRNIAISKNVDLSVIKYDKEAVKRLYHFKGSM